MQKRLKLKVRKFWGLIPTFVEVTGEKLVGGSFWSPPPLPLILKRVKIYFVIFYWSSTIESYNMSINRKMYLRLCSSSIDVPRKCNDNRFDKITWPWKKRFLTDLCQRIDERCSNHPDTPSRKKHLDWGGLVRTP